MKTPRIVVVGVGIVVIGLIVAIARVGTEPADASATDSIEVSAGEHHTCLVTSGGAAKCWGSNFYGQLGNGTGFNNITPGTVLGLSFGVSSLSAGKYHTCAVTSCGGAKCWGPALEDVSLAGVTAISVGYDHTCALTTAGGVKCWGNNGVKTHTTPTDVPGLASGVAAVSAGYSHTCALTVAGGVKCWGGGILGDVNNSTFSLTPVDVVGLTSGVAAVDAGEYFTCAVTNAGGVKCWGFNQYGQLGNGTNTGPDSCFYACSKTPVDVVGLTSGVSQVEADSTHACARTTAGGAKCWGRNGLGELGNGTTMDSTVPVNVAGLSTGVAEVDAGGLHTCARMTGGAVKCWGDNNYGKLGDGSGVHSSVPVSVSKVEGSITATPTSTSTALPEKTPDADTDGDTIANDVDTDDDNDACPDVAEVQTAAGSQLSGGLRNPHDGNDYFNPSLDGLNRIDDVLLVVQAYFDDDDDGNPGLPPYEPGYDPGKDRTYVGPLAWNLGAPNGLQRVDDILNSVKQYFHDCS